MLLRGPSSTLFPYTTLFRSLVFLLELIRGETFVTSWSVTPAQIVAGHHLITILTGVTDHEATKDRKSTRLNSSHVEISYAVFGLKKKTCTSCCIWSSN